MTPRELWWQRFVELAIERACRASALMVSKKTTTPPTEDPTP